MLAKRIIPCMDVKDNNVVKGKNFKDLVYAGNPVELAKRYVKEGADELVFLDISATNEKRKTILDMVKKIAENIDIPFTVGGGISSIEDIKSILKSGADKVSINTSAILDPGLIKKASYMFGSQCIVVAIDAKKNIINNTYEVFIRSGKQKTGLDAKSWAKKAESYGAGEILLTSIDRDGTNSGFNIILTKQISEGVNIPVIASGGAGNYQDFLDIFKKGKADAALAASVFHYKNQNIDGLKSYLRDKELNIRI